MKCSPCEYDDPERQLASVEGWACWRAAEASLRGGMVAPHVDASTALDLAEAAGVSRIAAAEMILAFQQGMTRGLDRRKNG